MTPRTPRPAARARSARRPASSGAHTAAGEPDVDVDEHLGDAGPRRGRDRLLGVDGQRDTRTRARASAPSRLASATSLASNRSSPRPARAMPSISATVAQVKPRVPVRRLARRKGRALVRLDVRPQPVARKGLAPWSRRLGSSAAASTTSAGVVSS